jgi:hypothetical protein
MKILEKIFIVMLALLVALDVFVITVKWLDYLGYLEATEARETPFSDILNGGKKDECICSKSNPI